MNVVVHMVPQASPALASGAASVNDATHVRLTRFNYLVVDHVGFRARTARTLMKAAGLRCVEICPSSGIALKLLETGTVGAILVAFDLEGAGGPEFARRLRRNPDPLRRQTPIVMVTADPSLEVLRRATDAGVNELLVAPFSVQSLYTRVRRAVIAPKPFVVSATYIGPRRELKDAAAPGVPDRYMPSSESDPVDSAYLAAT